MTRSAYPKYKQSGVEWFPTIPEHWTVGKLKHVSAVQFSNVDKNSEDDEKPVRLCNYVDVYYNDIITEDLELMGATATSTEIKKFRLREGDVLITKDSESWNDIAVSAYVAGSYDDVLCGYHLAQIRPDRQRIDGRYLFRAFCARGINDQFRVAATGITRFGLGKYWIDNGLFPIPPVDEQHSIASFLEKETARIDTLIEKKCRQIELLQEKRAALISHAVTNGINPQAKVKDSGIPWLGKIPRHWSIKRLKFLISRIEQGWSPQCEARIAEENEWGVLKVGCVNGGVFNPEEHKALPAVVEPLPEYEIKSGDILMSRANTRALLGSSALVKDVRSRLLLCDKLYRIRVREPLIDSRYLVHYFATKPARFQLERSATGASGSMQNIGQDTIRELITVQPPIEEQKAIVSWIEKTCARIDTLRVKVSQSIDWLKEYRMNLISSAVTGKINVHDGGQHERYND